MFTPLVKYLTLSYLRRCVEGQIATAERGMLQWAYHHPNGGSRNQIAYYRDKFRSIYSPAETKEQ